MSEENSIKKLKISIDDIIRDFQLKNISKEEFFENILECDRFYHLDLFPYFIKDYEKYSQVEVFYQKYLDGDMSKQEFEKHEQKFHQFVETLWMYNDVYVMIGEDDYHRMKRLEYAKKNKSKYKKSRKFVASTIEDSGSGHYVDSLVDLRSLLYIATREIASVIFCFIDFKIILWLNGCVGLIYFKEESMKQNISDIVMANQLFIR